MTNSYIEYIADSVQIPREAYLQLLKDQRKLQMLAAYGVDNWEFYDDALSRLEDE